MYRRKTPPSDPHSLVQQLLQPILSGQRYMKALHCYALPSHGATGQVLVNDTGFVAVLDWVSLVVSIWDA